MRTERSSLLERQELTPRELEVMQLAADGLTSEQIGKELYLATETIKAHVKAVIRKTYARNRTHAVAMLLRSGTIV